MTNMLPFLVIILRCCHVLSSTIPVTASLALFMMSLTVDFGMASCSEMFHLLKPVCFLKAITLALFLGVTSIIQFQVNQSQKKIVKFTITTLYKNNMLALNLT